MSYKYRTRNHIDKLGKDRIPGGGNSKYLKEFQIIFSPSFLDVAGTNSIQQLSGRPISIGQVMRAVEHMSSQFVKLHSMLAGDSEGQKSHPGSSSQESQEAAAAKSNNNPSIFHCVRLTGASIESTLWISWKHLEQFCLYGNAIDRSNGFPGKLPNSK